MASGLEAKANFDPHVGLNSTAACRLSTWGHTHRFRCISRINLSLISDHTLFRGVLINQRRLEVKEKGCILACSTSELWNTQ